MSKLEIIKKVAEELIEDYNLNYGNGYVANHDNTLEIMIEAPNGTTRVLTYEEEELEPYDEGQLKELLVSEVIKNLGSFNPDETFEQLWSPGFEIPPSRFINLLAEDKAFCNDVVRKLQNQVKPESITTYKNITDVMKEVLSNSQCTCLEKVLC